MYWPWPPISRCSHDLAEVLAGELSVCILLCGFWMFLVTLGVSIVKTSSPLFFFSMFVSPGFWKTRFFLSRGGKLRFPHGQFLVYFLLLVNLALVDQFGVGVSSNQRKSSSSIGYWTPCFFFQGVLISYTWIFRIFVCKQLCRNSPTKTYQFFT